MEFNFCMNDSCYTTTSFKWKKGWNLLSGGFATLCRTCGIAFENSVYCKRFHQDKPGWVNCKICGEALHLGCLASKSLYDYIQHTGVGCISCLTSLQAPSATPLKIPSDIQYLKGTTSNTQWQVRREKLVIPNIIRKSSVPSSLSTFLKFPWSMNSGTTSTSSPPVHVPAPAPVLDHVTVHAPLSVLAPAPVEVEGFDETKVFLGNKTDDNLQNIPKHAPSTAPQERVARVPVEGRGAYMLLHRYWPRVTDKELKQISETFKSPIVPLFEKVLTVSDAGQIGRIVIPKACAEEYFPSIKHPEGIPISVQDIEGKEWKFQFRFWPNNHSRMYVLEGITSCIKNRNLEAGDTVMFSRIEPGGKLLITFRKANDNIHAQDQDTRTNIMDSSGEATVPAKRSSGSDDRVVRSSKRLLVQKEEAGTRIMINTADAQSTFQAPPTGNKSVDTIEGVEMEMYDDPPIFGKKEASTSRPSSEKEQWAQCDNIWNSVRSSCSAPKEIKIKDSDTLPSVKSGEFMGEILLGETNKHPRHRTGCTCIVCIGEGMHLYECNCDICSENKRYKITHKSGGESKLTQQKELLDLNSYPASEDETVNAAASLTMFIDTWNENDLGTYRPSRDSEEGNITSLSEDSDKGVEGKGKRVR